jgi:hypothetical protein
MISVKRFSIVILSLTLGGCANNAAEKLPKLDASNYEAYADIIVKNSAERCYARVRSITQQFEECTYQLTNKYLSKLYREGKLDKPIYIKK